MKALLRAILLFDALALLCAGLLLIAWPWLPHGLPDALKPQPALIGEAFGIALLALAWLGAHAAADGRLTASVARAIGHQNWLSGIAVLGSLIALHSPALTGAAQSAGLVTGALLLFVGLGLVRLSSTVARADRQARRAAREMQKSVLPAEPVLYGADEALPQPPKPQQPQP